METLKSTIPTDALQAPFPWFGGKRKVAAEVWARFGTVKNYVEPFFGSGAVLLNRPDYQCVETVNDLDGYVANFWRAIKTVPREVAEYADNPVNENDLHARHVWLVQQADTLHARLEGDPDWCDPKIAGWWVWGIACWIGSGFCSGKGPWWIDANVQLVKRTRTGLDRTDQGVSRQLPFLSRTGQGVNRKLPHLGDTGRGVNRQRPHLGSGGAGVNRKTVNGILEWFDALSARLSRVRVCSGDWARVVTLSVTYHHGLTAVFLDPPYADTAKRQDDLYRVDDNTVAHAVRDWAVENGSNPLLRIALCGYEGEHQMPSDWAVCRWNAGRGMSNSSARRERIWFSPACLLNRAPDLFT